MSGGTSMDYRERYEQWLSDSYFDEATKAELNAIKDDDKEIEERFYTELSSVQQV